VRIVRYQQDGVVRLGILDGEDVRAAGGELFGQLQPGERIGRVDDLTLLPPVAPSKIIAVGLNYADHAAESRRDLPAEPVLFMKPPTSLLGPRGAIVCPPGADPVDYEAELAVVIGRQARRVRAEDAYEYVLGLTCANDVTARNLQRRDGQWVRAKGFDTFCPLGPAIVTGVRADRLAIRARLNGDVKQESSTAHLIFDVPCLLSFISGVMTLLPGDVILTGTPAGVGPMRAGDEIEVEIEGLGVLANSVTSAED
jgi:2-keto-4-pentenoate hydratase/2-oxohepta-3-ene-1,7-dioic acid hydratase in catechol pathway